MVGTVVEVVGTVVEVVGTVVEVVGTVVEVVGTVVVVIAVVKQLTKTNELPYVSSPPATMAVTDTDNSAPPINVAVYLISRSLRI